MVPHIIWPGGCFNAVTTYFFSKRSPNGRLMCMWRGTNCCMVHSSENNTFLNSARVHGQRRCGLFFSSLMSCGCRAGLWDFNPNSLLRCPEFIAVSFKGKQKARIFLQEHFGERITICFLDVVFRGRSELFLS